MLLYIGRKQIFRSGAAGGTATLTLTPNSRAAFSKAPNDTFDVGVVLNPDVNPVVGVDVVLTFDPNVLSIVSAQPIGILPTDDNLATYVPLNANGSININQANTTGELEFGALTYTASPAPGQILPPQTVPISPLATIQFQVKPTATAQTTTIKISSTSGDTTDSNVVSLQSNQPVDVISDATATSPDSQLAVTIPGSATPTPTPVGQTLQISVRFQGINIQRPAKTVTVDIKQSTNTVWTGTMSMTSDSTGKYTGTTNISAPAGTYDIYVKGPAHLKKRFTSRSITTTANNFDVSSSTLLSGDFNNDNTLQIGDVTGIISAWTQSNTPVTSINHLYDVEENDLISLNDVTAVISNWTSSVVSGDD